MKKKNLSLKLLALFGCMLGGFSLANSIYAMENEYDNLAAYMKSSGEAFLPLEARTIKGIEPLKCVDAKNKVLKGMEIKNGNFSVRSSYGEKRSYERNGCMVNDGVEEFIGYIDLKCGVSDLCFNTVSDILVNSYNCSFDEKGQQRVETKAREKAETLLRREIIELPDEIYSCLMNMEMLYDRLVKDEAQKTNEGMKVVSYKDAFKTAAKIELAKIKASISQKRAVPSVMDLYNNTTNYKKSRVCGYEDLFENVLNDDLLYEKIKDKLSKVLATEVDDSNSEKLFNVSFKIQKDKRLYYDI